MEPIMRLLTVLLVMCQLVASGALIERSDDEWSA